MADEESAPAERRALRLTLAMLAAAVGISLVFVIQLKPSGTGAFAFLAVWLALPHAAMAGLLFALRRRGRSLLPWCVAAALVSLGGLYVLLDAIHLHPDAQSAIGVVLTPVVQGIAFLVAAPLAWWAGRRTTASVTSILTRRRARLRRRRSSRR
jgi:hypothetical protein